MAKGTWKAAGPNSPIFKRGFTISSPWIRPEETVVTNAQPKLGEDLDSDKSEDQD